MRAVSRFRVGMIGAAAVGLAGGAYAGSIIQNSGNVVAYVGMEVPGMPGLFFGGSGAFDSPVLAEDGSVLFRGRLVGAGVTSGNERGLFRGTNQSNVSAAIRGGDAAPGVPGFTLNSASGLSGLGSGYRLSPTGEMLWGSSLNTGVSSNDSVMYTGTPGGGFSILAREGDAAPGTAGATLSSSFNSPSQANTGLTRFGRVLFKSSLSGGDVVGTTNNEAWYTGTTGATSIMVRKGDNVLGTGETAASLGFLGQINNSGQVLFDLTLGGTATTANDRSLWIHTPGSGNSLVLREGDAAPGTAGASFGNAANSWVPGTSSNQFTRSGKLMMATDLTGGDVVAGVNDRAIYELTASSKTLVSRRGDVAPGAGGLLIANYNNSSVSLNDSGKAGFQVSLDSGDTSNDSAILTGTAGGLALVAREGEVAPGTGGAAVFGSMFGTSMSMNDKGQILFTNTLNGVAGVIAPTTRSALYFYDPNDATTYQVARAGQTLELAPGDVRVMSSFGTASSNNTDGADLGFGHDGTVAVRVNFVGNTSAIVTFVVPEPATAALFAAAGLLFVRRRR